MAVILYNLCLERVGFVWTFIDFALKLGQHIPSTLCLALCPEFTGPSMVIQRFNKHVRLLQFMVSEIAQGPCAGYKIVFFHNL